MSWVELSLCMTVFTMVMVWTLVIIAVFRRRRDSLEPIYRPPAYSRNAPPLPHDAGERSVHLVARITQRFCPRCRAPLAPDAPEGLCPACLMAGGFASHPLPLGEGRGEGALDPAHGLAATSPHAASQPISPGEWTNLAGHFPHLEQPEKFADRLFAFVQETAR